MALHRHPCPSNPNTPPRFVDWLIAIIAWVTGPGSLLLFFGVFVFFGPLHCVDLTHNDIIALSLDTVLSLAFFVQHSGMVRQKYQRWSSRFIPSRYHGAVYTIASALVLLVVVVLWQESSYTIVTAQGILRWVLRGIYMLAIAISAWGILALGSFDTLGLRPIMDPLRGIDTASQPFTTCGPYRWVRHPLYSSILLMIWSYPDLTADRLLFNVLWTVWIIVGSVLEERDLLAVFGDPYRVYQHDVPMLIPLRLRPIRLRHAGQERRH